MTSNKLQFSIPANNQKIIELYNKIKKDELDPSPYFQRKLVWRKQHKYRFIETILLNFPFPEIYIAPGELNTEKLELKDQIVDGQQRLTTIVNYIEGKDVFGLKDLPINKFSDLTREEKEHFLNYEVSVRYLKNATDVQIKDIFQRINSTEYSLNASERLNAQWGDSEFVSFCKQIIEIDIDSSTDIISYRISVRSRAYFLEFFHTKYSVFTENDINRMLALQYILTLIATLCEDAYFRRNDLVQQYIENYFEEFAEAPNVETELLETLRFIDSLALNPKSYWFNKANIFTLIVEVHKFDTSKIDAVKFKERLAELETQYFHWILSLVEKVEFKEIAPENMRYFEVAKEAVNDKTAREYRGNFINKIIRETLEK